MSNRKDFQEWPDEELVSRYRITGEQEVLATVFLRYQSMIYAVCVKYLTDQDLAKDAVWSIYEELVKKAQLHNIENFRSWVYVLARNHCLMQLRQSKKMPTTEFESDFMQSVENSHPLEEALEKEQKLTSLEKCIEGLQEEQKQSIRLFYIEEKCYNDIAKITGYDWNKVRSLIQNGRRNLKNCMEQHAA